MAPADVSICVRPDSVCQLVFAPPFLTWYLASAVEHQQVFVGKANAVAAGADLAGGAAVHDVGPVAKVELEGWLLNAHR